MANLGKINEMKLLREALGLKQQAMGELMGVDPESAQSAWQRWEADPEKPSARKAFERAKEIYKEKTGAEWTAGRIQFENDMRNVPVTVAPIEKKHVELGFMTIMETLDLHQIKVEEITRARLARVLGLAARAFAEGNDPVSVRQEVIHEAELLLGLVK